MRVVPVLLLPATLLASEPLRWGAQVGLVNAQGDFRNAVGTRLAPEVGLWAAWDLTPRLSLRPTLDHQRFPLAENGYVYKSSRYSDVGEEDARWSTWSVGMDVLYRPADLHLCFAAGLSLKAWKLHSYGAFTSIDKVNGTVTYTVDDTSTKNEPAASFGLIVPFSRHWSTEVRWTLGSYRKQAYNTVHLRLVVAF